MRRSWCRGLALVACSASLAAQAAPARNVVLIVTDGLRWQEVFSGAERALMTDKPGGVADTAALLREFWREDVGERRAALMPFLWGTVAREGQIFGNQQRGSVARITNTFKFSYPGYNEIFTGVFDPNIDSNEFPPNPNETVFEWLSNKPAYSGRVAAFATWGAFDRIFNVGRSKLVVHDGWTPPFAADGKRGERQQTIDELYRTSVRYWPDNAFDAPMHLATREYIRLRRPRVLFVGYGETDEWAHAGRYDLVLRSAHQVDSFIEELWRSLQAMPQYRGSTTLIITTDHGRGSGPDGWKRHGKDVAGAEDTWIALLGAGVPPLGERSDGPPVTSSQIAATIAWLLGEDWLVRRPDAGRAIALP